MAKKRMFSLGVLETDAFMDMPLSAQALYFHLNMRADDDGFIGNPKRITQNVGANEDDLKILIAKRFVLTFEDGVIVIKHWRMHNAIKKDRYTRTNFIDDLNMLHLKENGSYTFSEIPDEVPVIDVRNTNGEQMEHNRNTNGEQMGQACSTGLGIGIGIDKDKVKDSSYDSIPLIDGTEWTMPQDLASEYAKSYPNLNIEHEVRQMRIWSLSNPTKRKTRKGITRFVNSWLSHAQKDLNNGTDVCGADNLIV